jgi:hypothetical protein
MITTLLSFAMVHNLNWQNAHVPKYSLLLFARIQLTECARVRSTTFIYNSACGGFCTEGSLAQKGSSSPSQPGLKNFSCRHLSFTAGGGGDLAIAVGL